MNMVYVKNSELRAIECSSESRSTEAKKELSKRSKVSEEVIEQML